MIFVPNLHAGGKKCQIADKVQCVVSRKVQHPGTREYGRRSQFRCTAGNRQDFADGHVDRTRCACKRRAAIFDGEALIDSDCALIRHLGINVPWADRLMRFLGERNAGMEQPPTSVPADRKDRRSAVPLLRHAVQAQG